jgi:hypothetical protein
MSSELVVSVEHVKYRQSNQGKSPLGTLSVFKDRVEWLEKGKEVPQLKILYGNIKSKLAHF